MRDINQIKDILRKNRLDLDKKSFIDLKDILSLDNERKSLEDLTNLIDIRFNEVSDKLDDIDDKLVDVSNGIDHAEELGQPKICWYVKDRWCYHGRSGEYYVYQFDLHRFARSVPTQEQVDQGFIMYCRMYNGVDDQTRVRKRVNGVTSQVASSGGHGWNTWTSWITPELSLSQLRSGQTLSYIFGGWGNTRGNTDINCEVWCFLIKPQDRSRCENNYNTNNLVKLDLSPYCVNLMD